MLQSSFVVSVVSEDLLVAQKRKRIKKTLKLIWKIMFSILLSKLVLSITVFRFIAWSHTDEIWNYYNIFKHKLKWQWKLQNWFWPLARENDASGRTIHLPRLKIRFSDSFFTAAYIVLSTHVHISNSFGRKSHQSSHINIAQAQG